MQLFAYTQDKRLIHASQGWRGVEYYCAGCRQPMRLRGGANRQSHFYHVNRSKDCRHSRKTLPHLHTQLFLYKTLPKYEVLLEHPFPEIQRIADVFWEPHRIVFEVQCSQISADEVEARNRDYRLIDCPVVWILHDQRYNRRRYTKAEAALWDQLVYYTNIDAQGRGMIYDQLRVTRNGRVHHRLPPHRVHLDQLRPVHVRPRYPKQLSARAQTVPFCFGGDALATLASDPSHEFLVDLRHARRVEKQKREKLRPFYFLFNQYKQWITRLLIRYTPEPDPFVLDTVRRIGRFFRWLTQLGR